MCVSDNMFLEKKKSLEFVIEVLLLEQVLSPKIGIPYQEYGQDTRG